MCNKNCVTSAVLSVIIGIIIGGLFFIGAIATITTGIIIALIFAALALLLLVILLKRNYEEKCLCKNGPCVLIGSIGTIVTGVIALSTTLVATSFASILLIGLIGFFFALTLISITLLIKCLLFNKCNDEQYNDKKCHDKQYNDKNYDDKQYHDKHCNYYKD